ncbi:MAG TPA: ATP synthase F1 subunit gamma [Lactobacillaceae bacterium]|jgi:F-type H+-transporting ATPase subunit gamma
MANLQDIKRRMSSVKSTRKITSAMQMVATAKLMQIHKATHGFDEYANGLQQIVGHLIRQKVLEQVAGEVPFVTARDVKKTGMLVITTDRGLVGSYNSMVIKQTNALMADLGLTRDDVVIIAVGRKGADYYRGAGYEVLGNEISLPDIVTYEDVREVVVQITDLYTDGQIDALHIAYNHYVNRLANEFAHRQLLPLTVESLVTTDAVTEMYEIEPDPASVLKRLLPLYVQSLLFAAIADAKTEEHAARSNAMRGATENADDLNNKLRLTYNRARQAAITTEITEITAGMAALED